MLRSDIEKLGRDIDQRIDASSQLLNGKIFSSRFREDAYTAELLFRIMQNSNSNAVVTIEPDPKVPQKNKVESFTGADFFWLIHKKGSSTNNDRLESIQAKKIIKDRVVSIDREVTYAPGSKAFQSERLISWQKSLKRSSKKSKLIFSPYYLFFLSPSNIILKQNFRKAVDGAGAKDDSNCSMLLIEANPFVSNYIQPGTKSHRSGVKGKALADTIQNNFQQQTETVRFHLFGASTASKGPSNQPPSSAGPTPDSGDTHPKQPPFPSESGPNPDGTQPHNSSTDGSSSNDDKLLYYQYGATDVLPDWIKDSEHLMNLIGYVSELPIEKQFPLTIAHVIVD
ncbi:MAG: hypothetical protein ABF639_00875 [Lacticaseibacillus paracasei]|uniref:hypothetical protein n=1 Tax=Lacticaseibacillus paracasei TaxID=1597 RepID=UPI0007BF7E86|nr:hypothetical protein [Lacticaseibacillus paracasei]URW92497.1 hypothetical protein NCY29_05830 [Lacticaseibacillus paracasei]